MSFIVRAGDVGFANTKYVSSESVTSTFRRSPMPAAADVFDGPIEQ